MTNTDIVTRMNEPRPEVLCLIAGKGAYPRLLAEAARRQGVRRIVAVAFRRETHRSLEKLVDEIHWLYVGQLGALLEVVRQSGASHAVMAGQITPTNLFNVRLDGPMMALLKRLKTRSAETIFGAVADELKQQGAELIAASTFMEDHMPSAGVLSARPPTPEEQQDIELGRDVARTTSGLDIGQTVVIKQGTILAVEAFEGTDETIARAGRLAGPGIVVVKVAKQGHDMRFDIPVVGLHTMKLLAKTKAAALAVEAGRAILLEREAVIAAANRLNVSVVAMEATST
jgi:DUF1009 family protein